MKENELMIGDYVKFLGRVRKINSIIKKDTGVEISFEGKNPVVVSLDEIEPVALTPEILEKNGFENDFYEEESVADYHTIRLEGYSLKRNIYVIDGCLVTWCNGRINVTTDLNGCVQKDISYVHELQHALRLCGIEKEIEL